MVKDEMSFDSGNFFLSHEISPEGERRSADRQITILRIAKLITDSGEELCRIRNISAGGVKAETFSGHMVGERILIELRAGERLAGSVAWSCEEGVGVVFDESVDVAQVLAKAAGDERRFAHQPRVQVPCVARLRLDAASHLVPVADISQGGMKVEIDEPAPVGARVAVMVDGLPCTEGVIRWSRDGQAGIAFNVQVPFDRLTRWLAMRLAGRRAAPSDGQTVSEENEDRAA